MSDLEKAFEEGYNAYYEGTVTNPYPVEKIPLYKKWNLGYREAKSWSDHFEVEDSQTWSVTEEDIAEAERYEAMGRYLEP